MNAAQRNDELSTGATAMDLALACLGGRKSWKGSARIFGGLVSRDFDISSDGAMEDGVLVFLETLRFEDGEIQNRIWRIRETPDGLTIEGEGITTIDNGRIEDGALVFDYRIVMGGVAYHYHDVFRRTDNDEIENTGVARMLGLPVMAIHARGYPR